MAAPTPVSAFVHSSTLFTAGVYLLIRFSPSFGYRLNIILLLVSGLTIFMAGLGADFQFDLRRIIALSILSQVGLMIITISIVLSGLDFFHLLNNALFNPLNPELNPICYLLALLGAHHFLHFSRIRVKLLTFRRLMSYIYGAPILDVSRSHTTKQHSR